MKRIIFCLAVLALPAFLMAQQATIKVTNVHIEVNGKKVEFNQSLEKQLNHDETTSILIFEKNGFRYGSQFTFHKGTNRVKLVRRGFGSKEGMETKFTRKQKEMKETWKSTTGLFKKRVLDNIVLDKKSHSTMNVSFNYELIY